MAMKSSLSILVLVSCLACSAATTPTQAPGKPQQDPRTSRDSGKQDPEKQDKSKKDTSKKSDGQEEESRPRKSLISDLTDPMRAKRPGTGVKGDESSSESILRMTPGLGGDPLAGLGASGTKISPDLRMLLDISRSRSNQARYRAQHSPPHPGTYFQDISTLGLGRWAERPQRDGLGRITSMTDASGNRSNFRYGTGGFEGMSLEPRGPLNPRWGQTGLLLKENPERGFFAKRPVFNSQQDESGIEGRRWVSPLSNATQSAHSPEGGRFFTRYDVLGRPVYSFDASGKLSFNRYGPHGNLVGTYNAQGKLTLFGHDVRGRRNYAVDSTGSRILLDQNRGGSAVIRTPDGKVIKTGGDFGALKPRGIPVVNESEGKAGKDAGKPEGKAKK